MLKSTQSMRILATVSLTGDMMKVFYDYIAIIAFFIIYKFFGIYVATASAIVISALQTILHRLIYKRFEKIHLITFAVILVLGGATLFFHNALFIKWKPSIIYWVFAIALLLSNKIGKMPLMQRMLESKISMPAHLWQQLNNNWAYFFITLGALNVYVLTHFSTNAWVNFKLFGTLGLTLLFTVVQFMLLGPHIKEVPHSEQTIHTKEAAANDKTLSSSASKEHKARDSHDHSEHSAQKPSTINNTPDNQPKSSKPTKNDDL